MARSMMTRFGCSLMTLNRPGDARRKSGTMPARRPLRRGRCPGRQPGQWRPWHWQCCDARLLPTPPADWRWQRQDGRSCPEPDKSRLIAPRRGQNATPPLARCHLTALENTVVRNGAKSPMRLRHSRSSALNTTVLRAASTTLRLSFAICSRVSMPSIPI